MALTSGTMLGQYEIVSPVGAGNMGEVYRARDTRLRRDVAIKVLPELASLDPERLIRFEQEARSAAAINHPNILAIYQMGTHFGVPYLVSELLDGKTLTESIRRGPMPIRTAIDYAIQIAEGLAAAHERGIVHRDLKPDNVLVTKEGRIKILDFGLAKLVPSKDSAISATPTITLPGVTLGTAGYMSPEQVRGLETDPRTDIFAFGAILYEMVMGKQVFQGPTSADTMSAILTQDPPSFGQLPPETPPAFERVIRRCLEKRPDQRFQSASDLAFALQALSDPTLASPSGAHAVLQESPHRSRLGITVALLGAVLGAGLAIYGWVQLSAARAPTVANYVQLTHDGQPKSLIGTDGSRLYLGSRIASSASSAAHGLSELSVAGGESKAMNLMPSPNMVPLDLSPDGSELLVVDGQGAPPKGPLWSLPILGGSPRRLGDGIGEAAAWSPDGKLLAYTNLDDLFVSRADGSEPHKLASVAGDIQSVTWSPDSSELRIDSSETVGTEGQRVFWAVSANGEGLHRLMPDWGNPPDECCGKWTADGSYFVFQSNGQIWALQKGGGWLTPSPQPTQLTFSPLTLSTPLPSKDGKKLFLVGQSFRGELTRYDSKTRQFTAALGGISAEYVAFSNDGKKVAYVSYRDGALWRSGVDGSDRLQLTFPPMYPLLPRWSPDGKKIIFFEFATSPDKPARMYEVSPDGGRPHALLPDDPHHGSLGWLSWSHDGRYVYVLDFNGSTSVSRIGISDRKTERVVDLANFPSTGRYGTALALAPDDSPLLLRDTGSQDVYSVDWQRH